MFTRNNLRCLKSQLLNTYVSKCLQGKGWDKEERRCGSPGWLLLFWWLDLLLQWKMAEESKGKVLSASNFWCWTWCSHGWTLPWLLLNFHDFCWIFVTFVDCLLCFLLFTWIVTFTVHMNCNFFCSNYIWLLIIYIIS